MAVKYKNGKCLKCGGHIRYSEEFDAEYCEKCDIWLIDKCGDPSCEFCSNRPERPSILFKGRL